LFFFFNLLLDFLSLTGIFFVMPRGTSNEMILFQIIINACVMVTILLLALAVACNYLVGMLSL
jgi:hypothetical protein